LIGKSDDLNNTDLGCCSDIHKHKAMRRFSFLVSCLFIYFGVQAQLTTDSVLVDGHYRTFHFKKPGAPNSSLVFILHGSGGNGLNMAKNAIKLEDKAQSENILLVYPDGYKKFWNECRKAATSVANQENIDEGAFFSKMIEHFASSYQIDPKRVFAMGFSGGGHMAYKLAITMPDKFKAITAVVANLPDTNNMDCIESRKPVAVMIINGTSDPVNPYEGGEVKASGAIFGNVRSTQNTFNYWATTVNGYSGKPEKKILPDADPADGKTIEKYSYAKKGKPEVVLLKVINGKHDHPGDIDIYIEAWNFFKRQIDTK
jgi:polyhydroxybutyrate depolymerase